MFKISYLVDDKNLPEMIRATFDHVTDLKVTPMDAAPASTIPLDKPRVQATGKRNFMKEFGWTKGKQFRGSDIKKKLPSIGMTPSSNWYVTLNELEAKRIKRVSPGLYEVL